MIVHRPISSSLKEGPAPAPAPLCRSPVYAHISSSLKEGPAPAPDPLCRSPVYAHISSSLKGLPTIWAYGAQVRSTPRAYYLFIYEVTFL